MGNGVGLLVGLPVGLGVGLKDGCKNELKTKSEFNGYLSFKAKIAYTTPLK